MAYKEAVAASSIANVLTASLLTKNLKVAGQMIESDHFHENYRASLVPELKILREIGHEFGAYGTYLSGAGPTVMLLLPDDKLNLLTEKINEQNLSGQLYSLEVDSNGLQVKESVL